MAAQMSGVLELIARYTNLTQLLNSNATLALCICIHVHLHTHCVVLLLASGLVLILSGSRRS